MKLKHLWILFMALLTSQNLLHAQQSQGAPSKVLIIGGGLAGLTVAKSLERVGLHPTIIERRSSYQPEGAGIAIPANGTWALQQLGINLEGTAHPITHMTFTTDKGETLTRENVTSIHPNKSQFYGIDRTKLIAHLRKCLENTQIKMGTGVEKLAPRENDVLVSLTNGEKEVYDFVIVADGMHSQTHELLDPTYSTDFKNPNYGATYLGIQIWRTIIPQQFDGTSPIYMLGGDKVVLLYPINDNQTYVYAHLITERNGKNPSTQYSPESLAEIFSDFKGHVPAALEAIQRHNPKILSHYLETSKGTIWSKGQRILFVGDASRGFSPMLQNGAAQAFEDAYVLGELFNNTASTESLNKIATLYEARRSERAQWIKQTSDNRMVALGQKQADERNAAIKTKGAPNVAAFKVIMKENP